MSRLFWLFCRLLRRLSEADFFVVRRSQRFIKIWLWLLAADVFVGAFSVRSNIFDFMVHSALLRRSPDKQKPRRKPALGRLAPINLRGLFHAALRFTWLSAIAVSFLSVAFSSSSVCCNSATQSLRPSSFAHELSVP